jgi:hypothetical protein
MQVIQGMRKRKVKTPAPISMGMATAPSSSSAPFDLPAASRDLGNDPTFVMSGIDPHPTFPVSSLSIDDSTGFSDIDTSASSSDTMPTTSTGAKGIPDAGGEVLTDVFDSGIPPRNFFVNG